MIFLPDTNAWIRFLNPGNNLVKDPSRPPLNLEISGAEVTITREIFNH